MCFIMSYIYIYKHIHTYIHIRRVYVFLMEKGDFQPPSQFSSSCTEIVNSLVEKETFSHHSTHNLKNVLRSRGRQHATGCHCMMLWQQTALRWGLFSRNDIWQQWTKALRCWKTKGLEHIQAGCWNSENLSVVCVTSYHQYSVTCHWLLLHASFGNSVVFGSSSGPSFWKKNGQQPEDLPIAPNKTRWYVICEHPRRIPPAILRKSVEKPTWINTQT